MLLALEVTDMAIGKLHVVLGSTLSLDALLAAEERVITDSINKAGFWCRKTQFVYFLLSFPVWRLTEIGYIKQAAAHRRKLLCH
jgi:hypothetical protein